MKKDKMTWIEIVIVYAIVLTLFGMGPTIISAMQTLASRMVAQVLMYAAAISVVVVFCIARRTKASALGYTKRNIGGQIVAGLCIATVTIFCIISLPMMLGADKLSILGQKPSSQEIFIFSLLFNLILVGFGEEYIFRGYMIQRIQTASGSVAAAVIVSSVMFGFVHFLGTFSVFQILVNTGIGLLYGILRCKIKNCTPLALGIAHGLHSGAVVILSYILQ